MRYSSLPAVIYVCRPIKPAGPPNWKWNRKSLGVLAAEGWTVKRAHTHDTRHVRDLDLTQLPAEESQLGVALARQLKNEKAILGIFDEGCMGMYNAIIDDELLNPCGIYKERFSQSALIAEMRLVSDEEASKTRACYRRIYLTHRRAHQTLPSSYNL